jgi:hypothetical protein
MTTTDQLLERIDELEAEQAQLRKQLEQTQSQYQQVTGLFEQFKTGKISRRAFLTSVTALAGVGFAAGNASAAPDWSNTSGYAGTEAQPLTGVNSSSGTFESLSTDELLTVPSGTILNKDSDQSVSGDSSTTVVWDSATELNSDAPVFADLANDGITIPNSDYSKAKLTACIRVESETSVNFCTFQKNGGGFVHSGNLAGSSFERLQITSGWVDVSSGDTFTLLLQLASGDTVKAIDSQTWFELEAI